MTGMFASLIKFPLLLLLELNLTLCLAQNADKLVQAGIGKCVEQKFDSADMYFHAATAIDSNSLPLAYARLDSCLSRNDLESALCFADKIVQLVPDNHEAYYNRGLIKNRISKTDSSCVEDYLTALQLNPGYFNAVYNLGAFYYTCQLEIKRLNLYCSKDKLPVSEERKILMLKAIAYFEKALQLQPANEIVRNAMIGIYKELDMPEKLKRFEVSLSSGN